PASPPARRGAAAGRRRRAARRPPGGRPGLAPPTPTRRQAEPGRDGGFLRRVAQLYPAPWPAAGAPSRGWSLSAASSHSIFLMSTRKALNSGVRLFASAPHGYTPF